MRCDACGARNSDDAAWCTQCYAPFQQAAPAAAASEPVATATPDPPDGSSPPAERAAPAAPAAPAADPAAPAADPSAPASDPATPATDPAAPAPPVAGVTGDAPGPAGGSPETTGRAGRDIREIDGRVEWRCSTCGSWVTLEDPVCVTCGAPRVGFGDPVTPTADTTDVPAQTLLGASAVLPGAGHFLVGRVGSGITRATLFLLWAAGGLWWILSTQGGRSPGVVLLVGAMVLWGTTLVDANAIAKGQTVEPFGVRGLLWTVVGVTGLLMLMVAFAAAGSIGG